MAIRETMTIDEAKICLSIQLAVKHRLGKGYDANALKLGIEALNRLVERRGFAIPADLNLLPGETK